MIIKKFQEQAAAAPDNIAVKMDNRTITYRELNNYGNRMANVIMTHDSSGDSNNQRVSLLFEHGVDMIIGVIGVLKAGKTYVPMDITYPEKRLCGMLEDSGCYLILTNAANVSLAQRLTRQIGGKVGIINIDSINMNAGDTTPGVDTRGEALENGEALAYILYTSGSTGQPKGVMQTHRNVLYYTRHWIRRFSISESDRLTFITSFSHDQSVQDIFASLLSGACLYPYDIRAASGIYQLYSLLMEEKITIWHSVPSVFRFFANSLTMKDFFYDMRWVLLGGEALRPHDLELFKAHFPKARLVNIYGQTESSFTSGCIISPGGNFDDVSLGDPLEQTRLLVVEEEGGIVEKMGVGEVVIASDYLSPGYWKDREKTDGVFSHDEELGRLYWTGDLGRLTAEGFIKMIGRKDFQVKIRGFRVESGEIESRLLQHPAVKEAVVMAREDENGDNYLCAYLVFREPLPSSRLREYLSEELPEYMIPRYFIGLEQMPVTPTGKIDRARLPEPDETITGRAEYEPPTNEIEEKLVSIWQEILEAEKIGVHDNFIDLGGHSLLVISIISKIHQVFNVELQLRDVFDHPTVRELSRLIMESEASVFSSIPASEKKEYYIATPDQKRMFALSQFEGIGTAYNIVMLKQINGPFDRHRFEAALKKLIQRHEAFRTSFRVIGDQLVQVIHDYDTIDFQIPYTGVDGSSRGGTNDIKTIVRQFIRPFDLGKAPLLRAGLLRQGKDKHLLLLDVHHIISDGVSELILYNDFGRLYEGEGLPPLKLRYQDYAKWLNHLIRSGKLKKQEDYWLDHFGGEIPMLNMPLDFPRPDLQGFTGAVVGFRLGNEKTQQLNQMAKDAGVTLFMLLLAIYNVLLHKYTGQEDIIVGSITAGRPHADLEDIVGFFAKTLPMRNYPAAHQSFDLFLEQVKNNTFEAFENQLYPFDQLVEKLKLPKHRSRNLLFDAAFLLLNLGSASTSSTRESTAGRDDLLTVSRYRNEITTTMFDLYFQVLEARDELLCCFQYNTKLFKGKTIELMKERFLTLIENILNNPGAKIRDLDYGLPIEKEMGKVEEVEFDF